MRHLLMWTLGVLAICAALMCFESCTPSARRAALPVLTSTACVILHVAEHDPDADALCATAEDLAPFVSAIVAERAIRAGAGDAIASSPSMAERVAVAELPPVSRAVTRRRCIVWAAAATLNHGSEASPDADSARNDEAGHGPRGW